MRSRALTLAFLIAAVSPAAAQPQNVAVPQPAPVAIDSCALTTNEYFPVFGRATMRWVTTSGLRIGFHNRASKPVAKVRFVVDYRGDVEAINDVGSFAPSVNIVHNYTRFLDFAYLGTRPNVCVVVFVQYADGTTWQRPAGRAQSQEGS